MRNLKEFVDRNLSTRGIEKETGIPHSTVRRWLKKQGLKTNHKSQKKKKPYVICTVCNKDKKPSRRKVCQTCATAVRRIRLRLALIALAGGKCKDCGLEATVRNYYNFEFHHLKDDKEFNLSSIHNTKSWDMLKKELYKCDLLCTFCHRGKHKPFDEERITYSLKYQGLTADPEVNRLLDHWRI